MKRPICANVSLGGGSVFGAATCANAGPAASNPASTATRQIMRTSSTTSQLSGNGLMVVNDPPLAVTPDEHHRRCKPHGRGSETGLVGVRTLRYRRHQDDVRGQHEGALLDDLIRLLL